MTDSWDNLVPASSPQTSFSFNADDWDEVLQAQDKQSEQAQRRDVPEGQHTFQIKQAQFKPATGNFPQQYSVQLYFPEFNTSLFENFDLDNARGLGWKFAALLSRLDGNVDGQKEVSNSWRDPDNHSALLGSANGRTGVVKYWKGVNKTTPEKPFNNFRFISIEPSETPF